VSIMEFRAQDLRDAEAVPADLTVLKGMNVEDFGCQILMWFK
jgi:hypothetical protein